MGEVGTLQTNTTGMCGECLQWMDCYEFATAQGSVYFLSLHCSGSRVLFKGTLLSGLCLSCTSQVWAAHVLRFSAGAQTQGGRAFCALPRSKQLRQPGACWVHCPRWAMHLIHLPGPGLSVSQVHCGSTIPGVPSVSSGELISSCDILGRCQLSSIPGRHG